MPARFPNKRVSTNRRHSSAHHSGQFGPQSYSDWRATSLGDITEILERRLVLHLAGEARDRAVLDVGCGDGALTWDFWRNGAAPVLGCDVDIRMIATARSRAAREHAVVHYVVASGQDLPLQNASFDLVTIITVLAFVPEPELAIREIARVLKPGGRLVIGDLGKWSLWAASRRIRSWRGAAPMWASARFWTAGELRQLVEASGLRVKHVSGAIYYPRSKLFARAMAPLDPFLGELTTFGAAFVALSAVKP